VKIIRAFMRFFFYQLYHRFAWAYDIVSWILSLGRWSDWVAAALEFIHGRRVLEIGFGPGHLQRALLEKGVAVFGLDESPQMAKQAARRAESRGGRPRLIRGRAQHIPFPAAVFDSVIATFPSEYIVDPQTLAEIQRILRSGGKLIVLAGAVFVNKDLAEHFAAWLFRVTGQETGRAELFEKLARPFQEAKFIASIEERSVRGSTLFFVIAQKAA
jgi:ubiquinone/menaquinone biosynthesis C-methylase UbiE